MPAAIKTPSGNRKTVRLIAVLFLIASGARRSGAQSTEPSPAAVRKIQHQRRGPGQHSASQTCID